MEIKRSPGLIITGVGIGLALLAMFAPDAPFAPSSLFLPVMLIFVGRAISRGARATKTTQRPSPTIFKMPPTVPPTAPRPPARQAPRPATVVIPEVAAEPAEPDPSEIEAKLRAARAASEARAKAEAEARAAAAMKASVERKAAAERVAKPPVPMVVPSSSASPVYPKPTPSSARARSSKEMVEEAKKRIKRD